MEGTAEERVEKLFHLAEDADSVEEATRYVERAKEVAESNRVQIPVEDKSKVCNGCGRYLRAGDNARVRLRSDRDHVSIRCLDCGDTNRHPYSGGDN